MVVTVVIMLVMADGRDTGNHSDGGYFGDNVSNDGGDNGS